jgi:hypothetical protein
VYLVLFALPCRSSSFIVDTSEDRGCCCIFSSCSDEDRDRASTADTAAFAVVVPVSPGTHTALPEDRSTPG